MSHSILRRSLYNWQLVAVVSLSVAILSYISPQVSQLGRGLRTTLPALVVAWFAIFHISPKAFNRALVRFQPVLLLGIFFIFQAALRFAYEEEATVFWDTYFWGPLTVLTLLVWVGALTELGEGAVRSFRCWVLFGWCISLAVSLPILIQYPAVAKLTMGSEVGLENAAIWAPYGVGEYSVYTSMAICLGPLLAATQCLKPKFRIVNILLVSLAALAVLLSTFAMAAVLLMFSLFAVLMAWMRSGRGASQMWRTLVVFLLLGLLPFLYTQFARSPQTSFVVELVVEKVERFYYGISATGLAEGDETGRGAFFVDEMQAFAAEPFWGYIPGVIGQRGKEHSSLSNSLLLFGVFGAALWGVMLWRVYNECLSHTGGRFNRYVLRLSWSALIIGGILNPLWYSPAALGALFALTLPARSPFMRVVSPRTRQEVDDSESERRRKLAAAMSPPPPA
jgi:hypothetical protein